jgi:hypothetical protein
MKGRVSVSRGDETVSAGPECTDCTQAHRSLNEQLCYLLVPDLEAELAMVQQGPAAPAGS